MTYVSALGYLAAVCSMASFIPQAWKIIRSRQTKGISAGMYLLTVAAFALWLVFGILQHQWPLVISNGVCLALSAFIMAMTLLPPAQKEKVAASLEGTKARG
jgi:MtN3 and saliva related transmembrane protein